MWWVKEHPDHSRGGFQNRDVGKTAFDSDFGPDYGVDYARFADSPDPHLDVLLAEKVNNRLFTEFAEDYSNLEIIVRNGFVILKGKVSDGPTKSLIIKRVTSLPGVREVIIDLNIQ